MSNAEQDTVLLPYALSADEVRETYELSMERFRDLAIEVEGDRRMLPTDDDDVDFTWAEPITKSAAT